MNKINFALFLTLFLITASRSVAQDLEYGEPKELNGKAAVAINSGPDVEVYRLIRKTIEEAKLSGLKVVESNDDADIFISFVGDKESVRIGNANRRLEVGSGQVAIVGKAPGKMRLLISFNARKDTLGEKTPAVKFAREFVKEYKKANGLK